MGGGDKRAGGGGGGSGAYKKHKYIHKGNNTKNAEGGIPRGEKGIFVTCDGGKERTAGQEAVSILNEYWEKLHPEEQSGGAASGGGDVSSALQAELEELKKPSSARFFWMQTKVHGVLFVKMRQDAGEMGPVELIQHIMEDFAKTKQPKSRFCIRLIPVEGSCPAKLDSIKSFTKPMCEAAFPADKSLKFAVAFDSRASAGGEPLKRLDVINAIVENIPQPPHKVDLTAPDKTVLVQVMKGTCAVSIVDTYQKHLKFNIRSLTAPEEEGKGADKGKGKEAAAAKGDDVAKPSPKTEGEAIKEAPADKA